jgi:hypothetical protein
MIPCIAKIAVGNSNNLVLFYYLYSANDSSGKPTSSSCSSSGEFLVNDVQSQSLSDPLDLCVQVSNLLDGLNLLLEELALDKVSHLGVVALVRNLVQV